MRTASAVLTVLAAIAVLYLMLVGAWYATLFLTGG